MKSMKTQKKELGFINFPHFIGIGADAIWAIALFFFAVYGTLIGIQDLNPDFQMGQIIRIGGIILTGWTVLAIWVVHNPIERRFIILLAAFPVVLGLLLVALGNVLTGNTFSSRILVKTVIMFILTIFNCKLAEKKDLVFG
jgi:hypothetical protein